MIGIDVHGDKGTIEWKAVRASQVTFAFVKASEGATFVDRRIGANLKEAAAAGVLVGPYHYARPDNRPSVAGAVMEADHFCDVIETIYNPKVHARPVLDIEVGSGELSEWAFAWCQHVEKRLGVKPIIYSYTYFIRSHLQGKQLAKFPLWLANYGSNDGNRHTIPPGEGPWEKWLIHQYTSNGRTPGVGGRCDRNYTDSLDPLRSVVADEDDDEVVVIDQARPKAAPKRIPKWVWDWLRWRKKRSRPRGGGGGGASTL